MVPTKRQEQQRHLKLLNDHITSVEVQSVLSLLRLLGDGVKESLVTCNLDDVARLQGEAKAYNYLIRAIQRAKIEDTETLR